MSSLTHPETALSFLGRVWGATRFAGWLSAITEQLTAVKQRRAEAALVRAARAETPAGERAFRELVEPHEAWLVHYLYCLLGSREDASDVAQDVLLRAYLALDRFRSEASFRTWLRRIATNQAYNSRRRERPSQTATGEFELIDPKPSIEGRLMDRDALVRVLDVLPYPYREALVLHHVEELSVLEVAAFLDLGESAAKMRLKRARDRFLAVYDDLTGVTPADQTRVHDGA